MCVAASPCPRPAWPPSPTHPPCRRAVQLAGGPVAHAQALAQRLWVVVLGGAAGPQGRAAHAPRVRGERVRPVAALGRLPRVSGDARGAGDDQAGAGEGVCRPGGELAGQGRVEVLEVRGGHTRRVCRAATSARGAGGALMRVAPPHPPSFRTDVEPLLNILGNWTMEQGLQSLPVFGLGISSGGSLLLRLPRSSNVLEGIIAGARCSRLPCFARPPHAPTLRPRPSCHRFEHHDLGD